MTTRTRILSLSALGVLLAGLASLAEPPSGGQKKDPSQMTAEELLNFRGTVPPWMPAFDGRKMKDVRKEGKVVAVGKDTIDLLEDGEKVPVRYLAHEALASGRIIHFETDDWCYLLEDVKVGDELILGTGTIKDTTFALYLSIRKRPGGKIPASRNPGDLKPYHELQQARIDFKEKGIPIPEHLRDKHDNDPKPVNAPPSKKKDDKK